MRLRRLPRVHVEQGGGIIFSLLGLVFAMVLGFTVYLVRHPLLRFAGETWIVEDSLEHADAILVLSDDNFYADRATRAAHDPHKKYRRPKLGWQTPARANPLQTTPLPQTPARDGQTHKASNPPPPQIPQSATRK